MTLPEDRVGYDPETKTYYAQFDTATLIPTIIQSVAAVTGKPSQELDPLYEVIDPDALEKLFDNPRHNSPEHEGVYVSFKFASCKLSVSWDGEIRITPPHDVDIIE
ncbi:hypothetical protein BG842_06585 [Haladaptatus sp. W1]|uniref:HalOD1 output domain-containing protein n=1 Tax=Haladaptatus sp. W1 TaxID=1897478 RepID=UPI00084994CF|nr:HalOD1 output domain-containing protein [Haladaptatus sp. W1]ODR79566.1 hypothetical protein BG842_06585 [Haladaptatus sp. W1]